MDRTAGASLSPDCHSLMSERPTCRQLCGAATWVAQRPRQVAAELRRCHGAGFVGPVRWAVRRAHSRNAAGRAGGEHERDHGREPDLRRDRVGETATASHGLTKSELEGFAAVSGDFNPTHLERRVRAQPRPAGAGRPRHVDGGADLEPARQQAARRRHRLSPHRSAVRGAGVPGRHGDGDHHRRRQGVGRRARAVRLPLREPERRAGAGRHGRGAGTHEQGSCRSSTARPSASRRTTRTKSCCAGPRASRAISLRRRLSRATRAPCAAPSRRPRRA